MASMLNWTMSVAEAFSNAEVTFGDDSTGEPLADSIWSRFATPGLAEETEPISSPPKVISAAVAIIVRPMARSFHTAFDPRRTAVLSLGGEQTGGRRGVVRPCSANAARNGHDRGCHQH